MKMKTGMLVVLAMLLTGCMEDGRDGATGPAGAPGEDGESYVSATNPVSGEVVTIAVTTGDNSPVEIILNTGEHGNAGNRRPVVVGEATEEAP
jgi:hypothetical protein